MGGGRAVIGGWGMLHFRMFQISRMYLFVNVIISVLNVSLLTVTGARKACVEGPGCWTVGVYGWESLFVCFCLGISLFISSSLLDYLIYCLIA